MNLNAPLGYQDAAIKNTTTSFSPLGSLKDTSQTSLYSYEETVLTIGEKQQKVYSALVELGEASDGMISRKIGMPRALVAARRGELEKAGLVVPAGTVFDTFTQRTVVAWRTKNKRCLRNG